jgi:hydroxymethylbilane synthase
MSAPQVNVPTKAPGSSGSRRRAPADSTRTPSRIRLGTRRSALATTQAAWVADRLRAAGHEVELVEVTTFGDTSGAALSTIGGTGVFAGALRTALLRDEIDVAVHSLKDLPVLPEPGLVVGAIPVREDPRDVLVARDGLTLGELPPGSSVGTGSPRRAAQLAALGLGLVVQDIRGNVDTRIAAVHAGRYDAVLLARAGLARLGRLDEASEVLDPLQVLPAPGQGALAVECRAGDPATVAAVAPLDDHDTRICVTAERSLLAALEAGCTAPIGALAELCDGTDGVELSLRAFVGTLDGSFELRRSVVGPPDAPEQAGWALAGRLLADGAGQWSGTSNRPPPHLDGAGGPAGPPAALDTQPQSHPEPLATERVS